MRLRRVCRPVDGDDARAQIFPNQGSPGGCIGRPSSRYLYYRNCAAIRHHDNQCEIITCCFYGCINHFPQFTKNDRSLSNKSRESPRIMRIILMKHVIITFCLFKRIIYNIYKNIIYIFYHPLTKNFGNKRLLTLSCNRLSALKITKI